MELGNVSAGLSTNLDLIGQVSSMLAVGAGGCYHPPLSLSFSFAETTARFRPN